MTQGVKPFKISVEHWDKKVTVEIDHSDITWEEYVDLLKEVTKAVGWADDSISELFDN